MGMGRGKYGCTPCNVQGQRPHLGAVLTMDGEVLTLAATVCAVLNILPPGHQSDIIISLIIYKLFKQNY
jgi:hypothetical protein